MNTRRLVVVLVLALAAAAFAAALLVRRGNDAGSGAQGADAARLVRAHAPVLGPALAPVTVVEFFDPACDACRAFHPHVMALLKRYPGQVRVVLRYAPLHPGAERVVALLEAARRQDRFEPVLEAVLAAQPDWVHAAGPDLEVVRRVAAGAGLDIARAQADAARPEVQALLQADLRDLRALGVKRTPTFFVNGRGLSRFGPQQLAALVEEEVARLRSLAPGS